MKILLTSDWHIDARTAGVPRINEFSDYIDDLIVAIVSNKVDYVFHLGDFFNPGSMLVPFYTSKVIEFVQKILDCYYEVSAIVLIAGNHDVIEDSRGPTVLSPLKAIYHHSDQVHVFEQPEAYELVGHGSTRLGLLALPYVARSAYNPDKATQAFSEAAKFSHVPLAVIGHQTVPGAIVGSETRDMPRGRDVDLPTDAIAQLNPSLVAMGHYHKAQIVSSHGLEIIIPGSPQRLTFGERNDKNKGFTIVDITS